jgi:hypothetical protein
MDTREKHVKGVIIFAILATAGLLVPTIGAVLPGGPDTWPIVTAPDLNISGSDGANRSMPAKYQTSPVPIRIEVMLSETLIPGPKGEMAAGPRSIGFSADPLSLAILIVAVLVVAAGTWFMARRKPEEPGEEDK